MIPRPAYLEQISRAVGRSPITALVGPRQCGKTTLARMFAKDRTAVYFDLESQLDLNRLQNPELMLGSLQDLVIIDEAQAMPELFRVLRVLVDRPENKTRFLILGSASPDLIKNVSETLAGRIEFVELAGFGLYETGAGADSSNTLWLRGGFPRSFLADTDDDSLAWREGFIQTFLARDIPQLGISIPPAAMRRFWTMLAHYHGQTWNASELGRSLDLSDKTVRSYLDILAGTFMVRQLQPWYENIGKRQVKAPKIYLRDSGILHALLNLPDSQTLHGYPRVGASWEGFAIEQVLRVINPPQAFFWATHSGAEIDLFFIFHGRPYGIECKFSEVPKITKSMNQAVESLNLTHLWVIHPGEHPYPLSKQISAWPIKDIATLTKQLQ
jgi:predicted AAA+ superfamily ATPase